MDKNEIALFHKTWQLVTQSLTKKIKLLLDNYFCFRKRAEMELEIEMN